jgi:CBS domain-containing protein
MKIKEVMEKPLLVGPGATKKELVEMARKHPHIPIIFVVDSKKKFLGDIHENDLFYMIIPNDMYDEIGVELAFDLEKKFFANTAKELMRKHDESCGPDDELMKVAIELAGQEINELPVIDKNNKVVGLITQGILLRHLKC